MVDKITQYKVQRAKCTIVSLLFLGVRQVLLLETDFAMFLVHLAFDRIALNEIYVGICFLWKENSCSALDFRDPMPTDRNLQAIWKYKKYSLDLKQNHFTSFITLSKCGIFNLLDNLVALIFSVHVTLSK